MDKPNKHIVVTFGRANPPHAGHIKLFKHMRAHAAKVGADHRVFLTHTQDSKENPLDHATKVHMVRQMDPKVNVSHDKKIKTIMDMMKQVQKEGYKKVTVVTGSDRKKELSNLLHKYNGGSDFNIPTIHFHEVARDPDNGGVSGLSATKMRNAAKSGDFKTFRKGVPNKKHAKELYMATRKGMKTESYKAFYLLGGPCSGKDVLLRKTILGEVCEIQLNQLHHAILHKKDIKEVSEGRALVVNGNAYEPTKVMLSKKVLESMGYETRCIYVDVTDSTSAQRNSQRAKTMTEEIRTERYVDSINNVVKYNTIFSKFYTINNEDDIIHEDWEFWGDFVAQLNEFYTGKNVDDMVEEFLDEGLTGATRMDIQKAYNHTFIHAPGWTVAQRTAHVEKHHQVKDVQVNSYGDVVNYKHLHEDKSSESGTNKILGQTARMKTAGVKKPVQNQGLGGYYAHVSSTQVAHHSAGAAKEKSPPVKKPEQPVTTSASGTHQEQVHWEEDKPHHHVEHWYDKHTRSWVVQRMDKQGNQIGSADYVGSRKEAENLRKHHEKKNVQEAIGSFKAFKKLNGGKSKPLTKSAKDPSSSFDSRVSDGMAMTATFAAEEIITEGAHNWHGDFPIDKFPTVAHVEKHIRDTHAPHRKMGEGGAYDEDTQLARVKVEHHQTPHSDPKKIHDALLDKAQKWEPLQAHKGKTHWHVAGWIAESVNEAKIPRNTVNHMTTPLEIERAKRAKKIVHPPLKVNPGMPWTWRSPPDEPPIPPTKKPLKKIKEESTPKSPQYDLPEVYEDWGLKSEVVLFEGREVPTNRPFKTNEGYAVYNDGGTRIEFTKKNQTSEDWS